MVDPLISIIIPVYNRAHLVGETLDSILAQTYPHWECILTDDHSTDTTVAVLKTYAEKDPRFRCAIRPEDRPKGANACRNYGFELSKGEYIQWFDSDDLMLPTFLNEKINYLKNNNDFIITKCVNFYQDSTKENISKYNQNQKYELNFENFLKEKVYWMTPDMLIKKSAVGTTRFDEKIQSGQEYNFFLNLLARQSIKGIFLNKELTLRRMHDNSVQQKLKKNLTKALKSRYITQSTTLLQVKQALTKPQKIYFLNKLIPLTYQLKLRKEKLAHLQEIKKMLKQEKGFLKAAAFTFALYLAKTYKKGYKFMNYARS
jgi:glycosyltransferase involved in cell wall biosynthesis